MEHEGLVRVLQFFADNQVQIGTVVTDHDKHINLCYMRTLWDAALYMMAVYHRPVMQASVPPPGSTATPLK